MDEVTMSELQEIDVYVKPDGSLTLEVRGVKGSKCLDLTRDVENLVGGIVVERAHTDEFHQVEDTEPAADLDTVRR
ncbi:MAG: DUF2997 domain-containing protein [Thermodesulfobacteriota bacterium]